MIVSPSLRENKVHGEKVHNFKENNDIPIGRQEPVVGLFKEYELIPSGGKGREPEAELIGLRHDREERSPVRYVSPALLDLLLLLSPHEIVVAHNPAPAALPPAAGGIIFFFRTPSPTPHLTLD